MPHANISVQKPNTKTECTRYPNFTTVKWEGRRPESFCVSRYNEVGIQDRSVKEASQRIRATRKREEKNPDRQIRIIKRKTAH